MEIRPCERLCRECQLWLHFSRFRTFRDSRCSAKSEIRFASVCKACEQKERNEEKNTDRPKAIIEARAATRARELGVPKAFLLVNMNWNVLVPYLRAAMGGALCLDCGHAFVNERDVQIEHREPPRSDGDWAREHASNIALACGSCNRSKGSKTFASYLDDKEAARLSNERYRLAPLLMGDEPTQGKLFT